MERTTHEDPLREMSERDRVLRLRAVDVLVISGPDADRRVRIDQPNFVIGSGTSADLQLADTKVSREHLRLALREDGLHLRDEGSKNGTWIGAVRISDAVLANDTQLRIGNTVLDLHLEHASLELPLSASERFGDAIGESAAMRHVFSVLERAAARDVTVLLEGESGVGKEVLARALHQSSPRYGGPFVAVDCGAIPASLIESELFGHERGAFTGADSEHEGLFEQANRGTLLLDEIGELALELQPKLLRVLEQRVVRRLGAKMTRPVDVRVVAASNRRLSESVRRGEFRADLFYRLAVARVVVPPLRDRPDDVQPIARAFLRAALDDPLASLPHDFASMLTAYRWPGNVRELRNVIDRYALLGIRDADALFDRSQTSSPVQVDVSTLTYPLARRQAIANFEREYTRAMLARAQGVVVRAAELAGMARPSFYRLMERCRERGET